MSEEEYGTWISRKELLELKALAQKDLARIQQLEEALRYIAEFDAKMESRVWGRSREEDIDVDAQMNAITYAFALGVLQGRARAALAREPSEAPEKEEE